MVAAAEMSGGNGGGGRCLRRRKIMEKECPISVPRVSENNEITERPLKFDEITELPQQIDFYTQARKALCLRGPFDSSEDATTTTSTQHTAHLTLPNNLAQLLNKHSDSRKRHKKSNVGTETKKKSSSRQKGGRNTGIWDHVEEYFRELNVDDIDRLYKLGSFEFLGNDNRNLLYVPTFDNVGSVVNGSGVNDSGATVKEEKGNEQFMDVDSEGGKEKETELPKEENDGNVKPCSSSQSLPFSGLEWLLGSRNKIYIASERPSKKRKLLGGDAGLEKLLVARPVEGSVSFCHYCSLGDHGDVLNRLIVCSSCNVAVHQRCYGVQDDIEGSWLCSWCKQKNETVSKDKPCVLCPKSGGALKPCRERGQESSGLEFAHLFCSQWMPEVFVENTRIMEPIMNVDGIKDTRKKLICYLCKVKHGACIRCSNGACRTSFHPICAREARHKMEIWGKLGCDDVELRAFCVKHSDLQINSSSQQGRGTAVDISCVTGNSQLAASVTAKPHKLKLGLRNGDKTVLHTDNSISGLDKLNGDALHQDGLLEKGLSVKRQTECGVSQQPVDWGFCENKDGDVADPVNFTLILKKLIEQKKVDVKDVAVEIGVPSDLLASMLNDDKMVPDIQFKVAKWLKNHAYIGSLQKTLKVKIKSTIVPKVEAGVVDDLDSIRVTEPEITDFVPVKSVPPRRRTKNNVRVVKDGESLYSPKETLNIDGVAAEEAKTSVNGREDSSCPRELPSAGVRKVMVETIPSKATLAGDPNSDEEPSKVSIHCPGNGQAEQGALSDQNLATFADTSSTISSVSFDHLPDVLKREAFHSSYIHPFIQNRLRQMESGVPLDDLRQGEVSQIEASSSSGICCSQHSQQSASGNLLKLNGAWPEQLVKASAMGLLELSPADEVEGELVYYQHRLLCNAAARKRFSDDLIVKVVNSLQQETDAARQREWDTVLVSQYLYELREAKKQGRKEKRHQEAQTVLAAATAAAAASSRISSLRKDNVEESTHQEVMNATNERLRLSSQQHPRVKETLSRPTGVRILPETNSDLVQLGSDISKDHARTCDVCRRSETILNPILVCTSCKVAVHLDCYRSVRNSAGPWYCELCEELLSSGGSGAQASYLWEKEKPCFVAECGLCGGTAGAFRKSNDGQWVHAFCAEWTFESTFRRGQVHPIEGLATVPKGNDVCLVCQRRKGVCAKCSYGHCQSTFHPSCARSAGLFLSMRTNGGKLQHKAYCDKHSLEQRLKSETQRHGVEELKSLKQVRVEFERLRLLCERIVKREKLKREVILCSHDILASSRDNAVLSALTRHPYFQPDVSSDSATTTSIKGYTDGCKSGSETIQRSDDITVDSAVAGKRHIKFPVNMDCDRKTDDISTSPNPVTQNPAQRVSFSGKQIPYRASSNSTDHGDKRLRYRKHMETFEKELLMTSNQASVKNQRLPKGYVYVPIRCLPKEEEAAPDECSGEPLDPDG
ncbi:uncharacterized protein LOC132627076 isoform X1 [Lycium barbarum]|uniref:uncharacterized protein LOC132627076 isoform X1 n=1 Tax=Lycium barbarum TaxID=112863 RepID=UPI00293E600D|nr:uncharacterized protein LOC132627076 isoform X1 [Lycium barbarum]